jgi:hypothetical protein
MTVFHDPTTKIRTRFRKVLKKVAKATQKGFERQGTHTDKYGGSMKPMATEPKRWRE